MSPLMKQVQALTFIALVILAPGAQAASERKAATVHREESAADGSPSGVSETSSKRIQAVVNSMKDILASVENAEIEEAGNYKCLMQWCKEQIDVNEDELDKVEGIIEDQQVLVEQHAATIANLEHVIEDNKKEQVEEKDALQQAQNIRDEEVDKFEKDETSAKTSIGQIDKAIKIVGKVHDQGGFLQSGILKKLQLNEPGESSYVLGIIKQLKKRLTANLGDLTKTEEQKKSNYDKLYKTKTALLQSLEEEGSQKKGQLTDTRVAQVTAKKEVKRKTAKQEELQKYIKETTDHCDLKSKEWQIRGEDRAKEKAALNEAISYLTMSFAKKAAVLVQENKQAAPSFLQVAASNQLTSAFGTLNSLIGTSNADLSNMMATAAGTGTLSAQQFAALKKIVDDLINTLTQQGSDEKAHKDHCESELDSKGQEKADSEDTLAELEATIEKKESEVETLSSEIDGINAAIEEAKKAMESATSIRKKEKKVYEDGTKDRALAIKVLKQATAVLRKFYETQDNTGLAQVSHHAPPKSWDGTTRKSGQSNIVMEMMAKIVDDVGKEQEDAEVEEKEAVEAFEKLKVQAREEFDGRIQEITVRTRQRAKVLVQLDTHKEDRDAEKSTLDSLKLQLAELHKECDELLQNFDKRTKARNFEIAQLRDVIDILSGASSASRTGLVQQPDGQNEQEMSDMSKQIDRLTMNARQMLAAS
eukprot:gnl/TRDRNA2_/TRDRNA2_46892_c0_seq1.p1 gnl/TRDRNA2_/TRDRNA2_46892_c0~~gnl/TRDRNA2_/TRDRNA2_46892_c0_seq1.p1  ORF type:complete len:704 (+),score=249.67 gnl/TRDRNA2_/TRDRNA2_46892_c0_seq1:143-2254(+)